MIVENKNYRTEPYVDKYEDKISWVKKICDNPKKPLKEVAFKYFNNRLVMIQVVPREQKNISETLFFNNECAELKTALFERKVFVSEMNVKRKEGRKSVLDLEKALVMPCAKYFEAMLVVINEIQSFGESEKADLLQLVLKGVEEAKYYDMNDKMPCNWQISEMAFCDTSSYFSHNVFNYSENSKIKKIDFSINEFGHHMYIKYGENGDERFEGEEAIRKELERIKKEDPFNDKMESFIKEFFERKVDERKVDEREIFVPGEMIFFDLAGQGIVPMFVEDVFQQPGPPRW